MKQTNRKDTTLVEKKTRWEIKKNHKYFKGIDETMSVDNCTHSFFGVSKSYGDLLVQEYGKNEGLKKVKTVPKQLENEAKREIA